MPKSFWPTTLALVLPLLLSAGCSKQSRLDRHLAKGDEKAAAGDYDGAEKEYDAAYQIMPGDLTTVGRLGILLNDEGRMLPAYLLLRRAADTGPETPKVRLALGLADFALARTAEARTAAKKVLDKEPQNPEALLLLAETSSTARDNAESRRIITELLAKNPDGAGYRVALGTLSLQQRDQPAAESEFRKALEFDPKSADAYGQLGTLYQQRHDLKQAGDALKKAADLSPIRAPLHLKYIDFLIRTGALDAANKELAETTEKARDFVPAWSDVMQLAFGDHKYDECIAAAKKILAREALNYDALMQVAEVNLMTNDVDGANTDLERIAGHFPRSPQPKYELAMAYLRNRDPDRAEERLHQVLALLPSSEPAILQLAEIRMQKGDPTAAITSLEPLVKQHTSNGRTALLLAQAYRQHGDLDRALAIFRALTASSPKAAEAPYLVGMVQLQLNRPDEARKSFEQSTQRSKDYWPAWEMLVDLDMGGNRKDAAMAQVQDLLKTFPKSAEPWLFRAKIYLAQGDTGSAAKDLQQAIELDPKSQYAYLQLARIYFYTQQSQQALDQLTALTAKTSTAGALMQLGMLQTALKHYDDARATYEKLLAADSKFFPALNNLASLYSENLGQPEKGLDQAKRARELSPSDPTIADTLGWINYRLGRYDNALPLLSESAAARPSEPDFQYHVGMAHYMQDHEALARQALQKALSAASDSPVKDDARRRVAYLAIDPAKADTAVQADLENAVRQDPKDPVVRGRLAAIEVRTGAPEKAAENYEALLRLTTDSASTMLALAQLDAGPLHKPERARELAKNAHTVAPNDAAISWTLGRVLYQTGDYAWSVTALQEAAHGFPDQPELSYELARAYYYVGRLPEAEAPLQKALEGSTPFDHRDQAEHLKAMIAAAKTPAEAEAALPEARKFLADDPGDIPGLYVTALAHEQEGDYAGAEKVYRSILDKNSAFAVATRQLAMLYGEKLGDDKKAEDAAVKALVVFPEDPNLAYELGVVNYRRADYAPAARYLQQSLHWRARDGETTFYLGMSHYQLKDVTDAKDELQQALALNLPVEDEKEAKRVLEDINRGRGSFPPPTSN